MVGQAQKNLLGKDGFRIVEERSKCFTDLVLLTYLILNFINF